MLYNEQMPPRVRAGRGDRRRCPRACGRLLCGPADHGTIGATGWTWGGWAVWDVRLSWGRDKRGGMMQGGGEV
eukprot:3623908-Prymnesium_polylepis.2